MKKVPMIPDAESSASIHIQDKINSCKKCRRHFLQELILNNIFQYLPKADIERCCFEFFLLILSEGRNEKEKSLWPLQDTTGLCVVPLRLQNIWVTINNDIRAVLIEASKDKLALVANFLHITIKPAKAWNGISSYLHLLVRGDIDLSIARRVVVRAFGERTIAICQCIATIGHGSIDRGCIDIPEGAVICTKATERRATTGGIGCKADELIQGCEDKEGMVDCGLPAVHNHSACDFVLHIGVQDAQR